MNIVQCPRGSFSIDDSFDLTRGKTYNSTSGPLETDEKVPEDCVRSLLCKVVILNVERHGHDPPGGEVLGPLQLLELLVVEGDVAIGVGHGEEAIPLCHGGDSLLLQPQQPRGFPLRSRGL